VSLLNLAQDFLAAAQPATEPTATVPDTITTGETVAFWILGPLSLAGALGMLFARNAVHSALWLALTMLSLGVIYMVQQAPFLGFVQIIVYTGAIMMLFLFVLMLVGRDSSDSIVEVLRGQRLAAAVLGVGFAGLVVGSLAQAFTRVDSVGLAAVNSAGGGNVANIGESLFTKYLFVFELTSALLITAAVGAMVLAYSDKHGKGEKKTQRELVEERFKGDRPGSLPGPGVFATANSVATPALLPDGSVAEESLSALIETTTKERLADDVAGVSGTGHHADAHALTGTASAKEGDK
jgi:NADH-quinone oxidoreductase subunit J